MTSFWIFLVAAIFFSALFSGMEMAFVSANKLKIELDKKQGHFSAKILSRFLKIPAKFICTMLLGNNAALVIYSMLMAKLLTPFLTTNISHNHFVLLLLQTIISTIFVLFIAEFLPKAILRKNPNRVLAVAAIPLQIIYFILYPFTHLTVGLSNLILKIFKVDTSESNLAFSKIDLEHFVTDIQERQEEGEEIDSEIQIFKNALDFSAIKVRECMISRTQIIAMNIEDSLTDLINKFIATGFSKILIYRDNIDNIIGFVHSKELFAKPANIKSIILPITIIPEAMPANTALQQFIENHTSVAVVVDEFGGTSGLVTTEDIIEEIFGEIEDEHDKEKYIEQQINENSFQFSGLLEIDYINEKYKLNLPVNDEYESLAGLIINLHESIPTKKEVIKYKNFEFIVEEVSNNRIELITLNINTSEE